NGAGQFHRNGDLGGAGWARNALRRSHRRGPGQWRQELFDRRFSGKLAVLVGSPVRGGHANPTGGHRGPIESVGQKVEASNMNEAELVDDRAAAPGKTAANASTSEAPERHAKRGNGEQSAPLLREVKPAKGRRARWSWPPKGREVPKDRYEAVAKRANALLCVDNVSVSFDGFKALNELTLILDDGELR